MKTSVWIAVSLLAFLAAGQALAQQSGSPPQDQRSGRPPSQGSQGTTTGQPPRPDQVQPGQQRLTPEERRKLRSDVNAAGRDIYQQKSGKPLF